MTALALMISRTDVGWGVFLTNGRELARFRGPGARWRAVRYLERSIETVGRQAPLR